MVHWLYGWAIPTRTCAKFTVEKNRSACYSPHAFRSCFFDPLIFSPLKNSGGVAENGKLDIQYLQRFAPFPFAPAGLETCCFQRENGEGRVCGLRVSRGVGVCRRVRVEVSLKKNVKIAFFFFFIHSSASTRLIATPPLLDSRQTPYPACGALEGRQSRHRALLFHSVCCAPSPDAAAAQAVHRFSQSYAPVSNSPLSRRCTPPLPCW